MTTGATSVPLAVRVGPRDHALDGMRVAATLLVIVVHICAKGFYQSGGKHWWAVNLYESPARVAVPLFFMISGALLLSRTDTIASICRRLWRILLPLVAWSVLYLLWLRHSGEHPRAWLRLIVGGPVIGHLWYLYALAGIYIFLPVLAAFHQTVPVRVQVFCLVFWFIGASLVPLEIGLTGRRSVGIDWATLPLYPGYMAIGALLYRYTPAVPRPAGIVGAWAGWAAMSIAVALATWWRCDRVAHPDEMFYVYSSPLVVLAALPAFVCLRALATAAIRPGSALHRAVVSCANVSFGVYLSHVWVLFVLESYGIDYQFTNPWIAIPLLLVLAAALSGLLVRVLQALPLVRAIVPR